MKLAIFHNLPSGGAKRALYNLVNCLARAGHVLDAFIPSTADEGFLPLKDVVSGYRIFSVRRTAIGATSSVLRRILHLGVSLADQERAQESIADIINAGAYDAVLSEQDQDTFSPFVLKYLTKPTLYYCQQPDRSREAILEVLAKSAETTHSFMWLRQRLRNYRNKRIAKLDKQNASFARYVVTNSYFSREMILRAYGLNAFVSYLGTDHELFRPLSQPREDYVLSVGACWNHKGHDFVIRSLGLMGTKIRPRFVIASNMTDPRWEAHLVRLAAAFGVDLNIKKCVCDSELVRLYNKAKLFLYAPYLEPFGLAPLEAMACGTPVIAVKEGGIRESIVDNETGILTERDEGAFAQATAELLRDDARRQRLGRRGLEVVRSFWTWPHAGERLQSHLERAAKLRRA